MTRGVQRRKSRRGLGKSAIAEKKKKGGKNSTSQEGKGEGAGPKSPEGNEKGEKGETFFAPEKKEHTIDSTTNIGVGGVQHAMEKKREKRITCPGGMNPGGGKTLLAIKEGGKKPAP